MYLLENDTECTVRCRERGRLDWDRDKFLAIPEIAKLGPGCMVLDLGAFVGDTTKVFVDLGCDVIAFEPFADAADCLRKNCPGATVYQIAVGNGRPFLLYNQPGGNQGARFAIPNWNCVNLEGETSFQLDRLPLERLDFVKMDVEGYEPFALDGARKLLTKFRPPMHVEVNNRALMRYGMDSSDILGRIDALGYVYRIAFKHDADQYDILCTPC